MVTDLDTFVETPDGDDPPVQTIVHTCPDVPPLIQEAVGIFPRDYQADGISVLYARKRAMLTDAPGLGKTPQSVLAAETPCLIVAPNYLTGQWSDWLQEHFPGRTTVYVKGDRWKKIRLLSLGRTPNAVDFVVVNKEALLHHYKDIRDMARLGQFRTVIVDEAHHFRNSKAETTKKMVELAREFERVYLLTATPIWREVDDLFALFRILQPGMFQSLYKFIDTWCIADEDRFTTSVQGAKRTQLPELQELLDVMRIGRSYKDAGRSLPKIIPDNGPGKAPGATIKVEFDEYMRKVYTTAVEEFRLQFADDEELMLMSQSAIMHTLRMLTASAWDGKMDAVVETLKDVEPFTHNRAVIFCWYKDAAEGMAARLQKEGLEAVAITGDIHDPNMRRALADGTHGIPCVTLAAMSEGVDLSWARHVIFFEEHWPPGSAIQSMARVVRERQTLSGSQADILEANAEPVLVHHIMVKDSIDEVVFNKSRSRAATIREVLRESLGLV